MKLVFSVALAFSAISALAATDDLLVTDYVVAVATSTISPVMITHYNAGPGSDTYISSLHSTVNIPPSTSVTAFTYYGSSTVITYYSEVVPTVTPVPGTKTSTDEVDGGYTPIVIEVPSGVGRPLITGPLPNYINASFTNCRTVTTALISFDNLPNPVVATMTPVTTQVVTIPFQGTETRIFVQQTDLPPSILVGLLGLSTYSSYFCSSFLDGGNATTDTRSCPGGGANATYAPDGVLSNPCVQCSDAYLNDGKHITHFLECSDGYQYFESVRNLNGAASLSLYRGDSVLLFSVGLILSAVLMPVVF